MDIFAFSSKDLTNVWAGVGARTWAVSRGQAQNPSIQGKARSFQIGSLGLFYCVQTKSLTTPFVVSSPPRFGVTISHIWPQDWELPFGNVPLGSPHMQVTVSSLPAALPSLAGGGRTWNKIIHITPTTVFAPSDLTPADWAALIGQLV